jgi:hypothetical protein
LLVSALVTSVIVAVAFVAASRRSGTSLPTAEVTRGEFVDFVELRGEIRLVRLVVLMAPMQVGDLQIVRLAKTALPETSDMVVEFDANAPGAAGEAVGTRQACRDRWPARRRASPKTEPHRHHEVRFDVDRAALDVIDRDSSPASTTSARSRPHMRGSGCVRSKSRTEPATPPTRPIPAGSAGARR